MHELSVTESLLEIALRHAEPAGAKRILALHIVVGQLSSIVDASVQFYWDIVARDTIAEEAQLHFRRVPVELSCEACGHTYSPENDEFSCPACGGERFKITAGEEFYLESIEIDK
ncbi:MAG: hydrogenase maturation nickel metallochaperone HypA [Chloroflexi bacterium]|nr:hydrogenase maturation nickel metallochaperone HypA [Chloroflexota bacterium]